MTTNSQVSEVDGESLQVAISALAVRMPGSVRDWAHGRITNSHGTPTTATGGLGLLELWLVSDDNRREFVERFMNAEACRVLLELTSPYDETDIQQVASTWTIPVLTSSIRDDFRTARAVAVRAAHLWVIERATVRVSSRLHLAPNRYGTGLYRALTSRFISIARSSGLSDADAADTVGEVWRRTIEQDLLGRWKPGGRRLVRWLLKAHGSVLSNRRKKEERRQPLDLDVSVAAPLPTPPLLDILVICQELACTRCLVDDLEPNADTRRRMYEMLDGETPADLHARDSEGWSQSGAYKVRDRLRRYQRDVSRDDWVCRCSTRKVRRAARRD